MKRLSRVLLGSLAGAACFAAASLGITSAVTYKPFGVPDHLREKYDRKVEHLVQQEQAARAPGAKPVARVSASTHDFGLLDPHSTASHSFTVYNDGDSPLELDVYDSTCKCTVGKLRQKFVDPGDNTQVTLTWNTGYKDDDYKQSVTLMTNDPRKKMLSLSVLGTVKAELVLPAKLPMSRCNLGEYSKADFLIYSQLWPDFSVENITSDLNAFTWSVEPFSVDDANLGDAQARAAWKVTVKSQRISYGSFDEELQVTIDPRNGDDTVIRTIPASGKVRPPIGFVSPLLHNQEGLVLGTMPKGTERSFHVNVQARSLSNHTVEVLDWEPKELKVSIAPEQRQGSYRLTITIPKDCPRVVFHSDDQHGYVQVGDPNSDQYSNWFPLRGVVCDL
ncbi:DUF1573 domain-containing protein [Planctomycetes bacterium K23_9]|uniref:DUF1573 domain-containing protein n=1 Tax=Stieleria marina TaxID=1930275 RepID=A0A517NWG8_9BACT|nr:hypothetical protein K239x_34570 [Planctomycetes bacterium K23_9]